MSTKKYCIAVGLFCVVSIAVFYWLKHAESHTITTISSYEQALGALNLASEHTLILFDIDDTLINPVDTLGDWYLVPTWFKINALLKYPRLFSWKNIIHYYSIMWQQGQWLVIEPVVVQIITTLKERGCTVFALSSMETGSFGVIAHFPEWRYQVLKDLGLEMSQNFSDVAFTELPKYRNNYPELFKGILCCNQEPKGEVVRAFLEKFQLHPDKIIFFDDQRENIVSVAQLCEQRHIPFQGFEYRGEKWQNCSWNGARAQWQLDQLMAHDRWFSDKDYLDAMGKVVD